MKYITKCETNNEVQMCKDYAYIGEGMDIVTWLAVYVLYTILVSFVVKDLHKATFVALVVTPPLFLCFYLASIFV